MNRLYCFSLYFCVAAEIDVFGWLGINMFWLDVMTESMWLLMMFCMFSLLTCINASLAFLASGVSFLNDSSMYVIISASSTDFIVR